MPFVLTARAENHLRGRDDLADTIARLQRYEEAGADVLYAPGSVDLADIRRVVESVDRPVNVLALPGAPTVAELAALGVARVSVGSGFAMVALSAVVGAARELADEGTYGFWDQVGRGAGHDPRRLRDVTPPGASPAAHHRRRGWPWRAAQRLERGHVVGQAGGDLDPDVGIAQIRIGPQLRQPPPVVAPPDERAGHGFGAERAPPAALVAEHPGQHGVVLGHVGVLGVEADLERQDRGLVHRGRPEHLRLVVLRGAVAVSNHSLMP